MQGAAPLQEGRAQEALARWCRTETCPRAAQVVFCSPVTVVELPLYFLIFADSNPDLGFVTTSVVDPYPEPPGS